MTLQEGIQHNLYKISIAFIHYFWIFPDPAALNE